MKRIEEEVRTLDAERGLFEDNTQIAYLISQKRFPLKYKPIEHDGKIKFFISGPGLDQAIQNFFANENVPVQDYLRAFSTVKNIVSAMKAMSG
jgi:hypothetical protein